VAFSNTVTANGTVPITFSGTNLPTGLNIFTNGLISGTPTTAGSNNSTLMASNAFGTTNQTATFVIAKGTPVISATPTASPINYGQALSSSTLSGGMGSGWEVSTLAGSRTVGFANGNALTSQFSFPRGVAVDLQGNVYVADSTNNRIRKVTPAGVVTTLAGSGVAGSSNGIGADAQFKGPRGIAVDPAGNVYVGDYDNHRIRKVTPEGFVSTLAGSGIRGSVDGAGPVAQFSRPYGVALDVVGNLYVAEQDFRGIRKVTPEGIVTTLAGTAGQFINPNGVAVDSSGNVYVADWGMHRIHKVTPAGVVTTLAGSGVKGFADGTGIAAQFNEPTAIAVDNLGTVYVADQINNRIRKVTPEGVVTTLAGSGSKDFADGTAIESKFNTPRGVTVDSSGNVYVGDTGNHRIRQVTPSTLGAWAFATPWPDT
jgi:sugar lactone lactonase YvrE